MKMIPVYFQTDTELVDKAKDLIHHDTFKLVLLALVEIAAAWILSSLVKRWCQKVAQKSLNKGVMTFLGSFASIAIKVAGVIIALDQLGVSMNVIVGTMSGLGVGVALALKNNMASVASGLQILLTKPFKVGDYIQIGTNYGTVTSIELTFTTLLTNNNDTVVIPNNNFLSNNMINFSTRPTIRSIIDFPCNASEIGYYLDRLALCAINSPLVLRDPEPVARVDHYQSGGTADLKLIYYCNVDEYWQAYDQVTLAISKLYDQTIPKTAPKDKESEPEIHVDAQAASTPAPELNSAPSISENKPTSVKQEIKQIVSDILPIQLPGMPDPGPLQVPLSDLLKNAAPHIKSAASTGKSILTKGNKNLAPQNDQNQKPADSAQTSDAAQNASDQSESASESVKVSESSSESVDYSASSSSQSNSEN